MLKSIALAAAIALTGGGLAVAQNGPTGAALVDALFANLEKETLAGLRTVSTARGVLSNQNTADHYFNVVAGPSYVVIGACDENCSDVDLGVYNGSGAVVGTDVEDDDAPVVAFEATETGRHQFTVLMSTCTGNCNYGVRVYTQ